MISKIVFQPRKTGKVVERGKIGEEARKLAAREKQSQLHSRLIPKASQSTSQYCWTMTNLNIKQRPSKSNRSQCSMKPQSKWLNSN